MKKVLSLTICSYICAFVFVGMVYAQTEAPRASGTPKPTEKPRESGDPKTRERIKEMQDKNKELKDKAEMERKELRDARASGLNEMKTARASARAERKEDRCERVTERVKDVTARYENNHKGALQRYQNIKARLQKMITELKAKGADTMALEVTAKGLDQKITAVGTAHQEYIKALESSKQYGCGTSEGEFKQAMEEAKLKMQAVRDAVADARLYYQETVRPEIIKLRQQMASSRPASTRAGSPRPSATAVATPVATASPSAN